MKYITSMNAVWSVSERNFKKLKKDLKTGSVEDLDSYGKMIIDKLYTIDEIESELEDDETSH